MSGHDHATQVDAATGRDDDRERLLAEAVAQANLPTLLMVLVQLTGERRWLEPPYRPQRAQGMGDNDDGGITAAAQQEVREAALEAIGANLAGRPAAMPRPTDAMLVEMLSCSMGEAIPAEYGPMIAEQLGLPPEDAPAADAPMQVPEGFSVLVIGAGASGMCAGIRLQEAGVPFTILEQRDHVGGVWWENRYPGAGVDTPNHLYSYSFAPYDWSMYFVLRDELYAYLNHVADRFDLRKSIRFGTTV
jgi:4-hydroxyacetophenone monooxygenase